jgi:hypothetical protein
MAKPGELPKQKMDFNDQIWLVGGVLGSRVQVPIGGFAQRQPLSPLSLRHLRTMMEYMGDMVVIL